MTHGATAKGHRLVIGTGLEQRHRLLLLLLVTGSAAQAGRDHGHAQRIAHGVVVDRTEDDGGIFRGIAADGVHHFLGLGQLQRAAGRDVDQHAARARQVHAFQQRACHSLLGGQACTVDAGHGGRAHHRLALFAHHGLHVFKVDVHQTVDVDDFCNAGHSVVQHVVGALEALVHLGVVAHDFEELLVKHDDQRINVAFEFVGTMLAHLRAACALKVERLGDHAHRQDAHFLGDLCDHRGRARARAAAHAGGDEDHVRAAQCIGDLFTCFICAVLADFWLGTRAQARAAQLQHARCGRALERLRIGVHADEFHALHAAADHVLHGVTARAADADHLDDGAVLHFRFNHVEVHRCLQK